MTSATSQTRRKSAGEPIGCQGCGRRERVLEPYENGKSYCETCGERLMAQLRIQRVAPTDRVAERAAEETVATAKRRRLVRRLLLRGGTQG